MAYIDQFGFLNIEENYYFEGGSISTLDSFLDAKENVLSYVNKDGFVYPPMAYGVKLDSENLANTEKIPNTERPSQLYKLPDSHLISIPDDGRDRDIIRKSDGAFIISLLAYIYGTRLQFSGWWSDSRVPVKSCHNINVVKSTVEDFLSKSYVCFKNWPHERQQWFINMLIMHTRAPSYEWDWERFTVNYMVFDGAYRIISDIFGLKAKNHKQRFQVVCDKFDIRFNDEMIEQIYKLRNELFHQAIWDKGLPGSSSSSNSFIALLSLEKINSRLIPAILGYDNAYIHSPWWTLGSNIFDRDS